MATTPLPSRTPANDQRIMSTPYQQLTQRQLDYADKYGLDLQPRWTGAPSQPPVAPVAAAPVGEQIPEQQKEAVDPNAGLIDYYKQRDKEMAEGATRRQRDDAFAAASALLEEYGLGTLKGTVQEWVQQDLSATEISLRIRDTKEFKDEYGGVMEARKKANLPAVSVSEILNFRKHAAELFQAAGLPKGFHDDKSDYDKYIAGDVSLAELSDRINLAAQAAFKAPKETRDALVEWGMTPGDMTAFWLNPDTAQPLLERKYAAAQLSGAAKRSGFGSLGETEATDLAILGVTQDEAAVGFSELTRSTELYNPLSATDEAVNREEQIGARFGGNAQAQARIERNRRRHQAQFEAGGGFAASQSGISGLGRPAT